MTPLSCNKPSPKMRRLFYCEKCLLFVCYLFAIALKNGVKEDSGESAVGSKKFFAVKERSGQLFAIVCYYARKRQFLSALDSQKRELIESVA